jgi:hypothetical protein
MKKPGVAGFFISAINPLPIERAAANAKPGTEDFNGPILVTHATIRCCWPLHQMR